MRKTILELVLFVLISVAAGCGGGGGKGSGTPQPPQPPPEPPPVEDTSPPIISNIAAVEITTESADITWQTDEPSTSHVEYGIASTYQDRLDADDMVSDHRMALVGLEPSTTYHFRVSSIDARGNLSTSEDRTFVTEAAPIVQPRGRIQVTGSLATFSVDCQDSVETIKNTVPEYPMVFRAKNLEADQEITIKLKQIPLWVPWRVTLGKDKDAQIEMRSGGRWESSSPGGSLVVSELGDASKGIAWKGSFAWVNLYPYAPHVTTSGSFEVPDVQISGL